MTRVRKQAATAPTWLSLLALAGCVALTVNVTFPQEKIDSAASSIEDLVREPNPPPADGPKPAPRSDVPRAPGAIDGSTGAVHVVARWPTWLGPARAEAQVPDLKTRTPQVMAVIESRRTRYPEVRAAMAKGCVGENNQGLLEARPAQGCPPNVGALVEAENRDRMVLYRTIVEQNNMPPGDLTRVQSGFARAHRDRAPAGAWVQEEGGKWLQK
jgi:uncharacterized protein YdbL (DUF1318 family)